MMRSTVAGFKRVGQAQVGDDRDSPSTRIPPCTATITSGTVDIPDHVGAEDAQHAILGARLEVRPATAAYTPSRNGCAARAATSRASARSAASYGADMSGKRGPSRSSFGPMSGLSPSRLM